MRLAVLSLLSLLVLAGCRAAPVTRGWAPQGLAALSSGAVLVADEADGSLIELPSGPRREGGRRPFAVVTAGERAYVTDRDAAALVEVDLRDGGRRIVAELVDPCGLVLERSGTLVVADAGQGLVRVDPANGRTEVLPSRGLGEVRSLALGPGGRLLVGDVARGRLLEVHPRTGAHRVLARGLGRPEGLAALKDGSVLVSDREGRRLLRVTPEGVRELAGSGPALGSPAGLLAQGTRVLLADPGIGAVLEVDPETGARTVLAGTPRAPGPRFVPEGLCSGAGRFWLADRAAGGLWSCDPVVQKLEPVPCRPLSSPAGIAWEPGGTLAVVSRGEGALLRVDPDDGRTTVLAADLPLPKGVAAAPDGRLFVSDEEAEGILAVADGQATLLSGPGRGEGPLPRSPSHMAWDPQIGLVLADDEAGVLLAVDADTGDRKVIAGELGYPYGVAPGLWVTDDRDARLLHVDPRTGDRELVEGEFLDPVAVAEVEGTLAVADAVRPGLALRAPGGAWRWVSPRAAPAAAPP